LHKAQSDGASDFTGFRVQELKSTSSGWDLKLDGPAADRELSAAILIGADGRNSWVANLLGLSGRSPRGRRAIGFQMRLKCSEQRRGSVDIHLFPGGYAGLVGLGDGTLNLCLAVEKARLPNHYPVQHLMQSCLPKNRCLKVILERSSLLGEVRSVYPVYFPPRRSYAHRALLIGDAARVNEPVTGEGIYFALKSGIIAAAAVHGAFARGDLSAAQLSSYARECDRAFRWRRWMNSLIRSLIYHPLLLSSFMRCSPTLRPVVANFVHAICAPASEELQWTLGNTP
jgi:flavin-dependent dehydrogenase